MKFSPFLTGAGALLLPPLIYGFVEPYRLVVRRFDVEVENLPESADGLRLAHLSDLHCSAITSSRFLRRAIETCNAEAPDLVLMTGDYVSRRDSYLPFTGARLWSKPMMEYAREVAGVLADLRAPEGVFAVSGNHDSDDGNWMAIADLLQSCGVTPLLNTSVRVRDLPILGVDDLRVGRPDVRAACEGISRHAAHLVLSHNPRVFALVENRNCVMLAGHTHSGQVHLPLTSFRRTPKDTQSSPWQGGWYQGQCGRLYVSAGVGSVHFPLRFACPPEIVILTLKRK